MTPLAHALAEARACRVCEDHLPLGPRPVLVVRATARLLVVGQAPGTRVHETGIPFNERSGDRLRQWLGFDREAFYDAHRVAIIPIGFCYPGRDKHGGDRPPRPECAPLWHPRLRPLLADIRLTLLVGGYAQRFYLGEKRRVNVTQTVRHWRDYLPEFFVLPHPSWRNTGWIRQNPWFEAELIPDLRAAVARALA